MLKGCPLQFVWGHEDQQGDPGPARSRASTCNTSQRLSLARKSSDYLTCPVFMIFGKSCKFPSVVFWSERCFKSVHTCVAKMSVCTFVQPRGPSLSAAARGPQDESREAHVGPGTRVLTKRVQHFSMKRTCCKGTLNRRIGASGLLGPSTYALTVRTSEFQRH